MIGSDAGSSMKGAAGRLPGRSRLDELAEDSREATPIYSFSAKVDGSTYLLTSLSTLVTVSLYLCGT